MRSLPKEKVFMNFRWFKRVHISVFKGKGPSPPFIINLSTHSDILCVVQFEGIFISVKMFLLVE